MKRLMVVTGILGVTLAVQAETLAFYPFTEGKQGETVSGKTVSNSVDAAKYAGTFSTVGAGTSEALVYDDDLPARYLYQGVPKVGSLPLCSSWRSVRSDQGGSGNTTIGGNISFEGLATALSSNQEFTIEFFYKIPTSEVGKERTVPMMQFDLQSEVVYVPNQTSQGNRAMTFFLHHSESSKLSYPRLATSWGRTNTYRTFGYPNTATKITDLADGEWHHVAIVCTEGGKKYLLWCDYYAGNSDTYGTGSMNGTSYTTHHTAQTVSRPLDLFKGAFRGKIAGLRITDSALTPSSFLYAFDFLSTDTVFHWRFDGQSGNPLPAVITNAAPSFASSLSNQFYRCCNQGIAPMRITGNGKVGQTTETLYPVFSGVVWKPYLDDGTGFCYENPSSALFQPTGDANASFQIRCAWAGESSDQSLFTPGESFTMECLARFDYEGWLQRRGTVSAENYLTILGFKGQYGGTFARIYYIVNSKGQYVGNNLTIYRNGGSTKNWSFVLADPEKWHHFAWVYDKDNAVCKVYVDRAEIPVVEADLTGDLPKVPSDMYFFAGGANDVPTFDGQIDEVRLTARVLLPSEFIRKGKRQTGLSVLIR